MKHLIENEKGFALILTILVISLIITLTLQFNKTMRSDLYAAVTLKDGVRLTSIARSGIAFSLAVLLKDASENDFDTLSEPWADSKALSSGLTSLFDEGKLDVRILDHSGRININQLIDQNGKFNPEQENILTRFLNSEEFGLDPEDVGNIIDAIKDWMDPDDEVTRFGAENSYYAVKEKPYSCKNGKLDFLEELLFVRGITRELFYGTKDNPGISAYLTTHGDGRININTAHPFVLSRLSAQIDQDMVENMVEYRADEKNDLKEVTWYKKVPGMSDIAIDSGLVTTTSTNFEVTAEGVKDSVRKLITAMVERNGEKVRILSWKIE